jgi:hypothetical protein
MRAHADTGVRHSIVLNFTAVRPASASPLDVDAARRIDGLSNRFFADPLLRGSYPADVLADLSSLCDWGFVRPGDDAIIATPVDLLGVNYYSRTTVAYDVGSSDDATGGPSPYPGCDDVRTDGLGQLDDRVHRLAGALLARPEGGHATSPGSSTEHGHEHGAPHRSLARDVGAEGGAALVGGAAPRDIPIRAVTAVAVRRRRRLRPTRGGSAQSALNVAETGIRTPVGIDVRAVPVTYGSGPSGTARTGRSAGGG